MLIAIEKCPHMKKLTDKNQIVPPACGWSNVASLSLPPPIGGEGGEFEADESLLRPVCEVGREAGVRDSEDCSVEAFGLVVEVDLEPLLV